MTEKYANLRARLAALKLAGPVSTDARAWNAATDALDVELVAELLAERDAMVQPKPAEVSDEQIRQLAIDTGLVYDTGNKLLTPYLDYIDLTRHVLTFARAILALRPAQQATPDAIREHLEGVASRASTGEQFNAFKWVIDTAFESLNLLPAQQATPEPAGEPFGWWFTEDPAVFSMPGSGFRRFPNKPQHTVECVPLYTHAAQPVPMTEGAKRALISNFFSEGWAQEQAMNLLHDYDKHHDMTAQAEDDAHQPAKEHP